MGLTYCFRKYEIHSFSIYLNTVTGINKASKTILQNALFYNVIIISYYYLSQYEIGFVIFIQI